MAFPEVYATVAEMHHAMGIDQLKTAGYLALLLVVSAFTIGRFLPIGILLGLGCIITLFMVGAGLSHLCEAGTIMFVSKSTLINSLFGGVFLWILYVKIVTGLRENGVLRN